MMRAERNATTKIVHSIVIWYANPVSHLLIPYHARGTAIAVAIRIGRVKVADSK